jgi:hypothetical protein
MKSIALLTSIHRRPVTMKFGSLSPGTPPLAHLVKIVELAKGFEPPTL